MSGDIVVLPFLDELSHPVGELLVEGLGNLALLVDGDGEGCLLEDLLRDPARFEPGDDVADGGDVLLGTHPDEILLQSCAGSLVEVAASRA